jgi:hypothetical protein
MFHRLEDSRGPKAYDVTFCGDPEIMTEDAFVEEAGRFWPDNFAISPLVRMARDHGWVR